MKSRMRSLTKKANRKKIALITTLGINIGDEFIRDGIIYAIENAFPEIEFTYLMFHKHNQFHFYKHGHFLNFIKRGRNYVARCLGPSTVMDECDAIIQCGAPIFWANCSNSKGWQHHLWCKVLKRYMGWKQILNIGGGSSYLYVDAIENDFRVTDSDANFIKYMLDLCTVTTVRDRLSQKIVEGLGYNAQLVCCPAFLNGLVLGGAKKREGDYIVINYMELAGHYTYGMPTYSQEWAKTLSRCVESLSKAGHKIVFLCHNKKEENLAKSTFSQFPAVLPANRLEYLKLAAGAKAGVCNRLHCAVVLASLGIPSVSIGNDSRLFMVSELGLPIVFAKDAQADELYGYVEKMLVDDNRPKELAALQKRTLEQYIEIFLKYLIV